MIPVVAEVFADSGLDDADRGLLAEAHSHLLPQLPSIASRLEQWLATQGPAIALAPGVQDSLAHWMSTGLLGPYDATFYDQRVQMGRRHLALGLPQHYIVMAVGEVRASYSERLTSVCEHPRALELMRAVDKLLSFELALVLRQFQLASETTLLEREREGHNARIATVQTLSAGFAHQIRNPINAAGLQLELLERRVRRVANDTSLLEPISKTNHELDRLTRLLDEFLAFARPQRLDLSNCDLVELARQLVLRERGARNANIELVVSGPVRARVDAVRVAQALGNLVNNALEAIGDDGRVVVSVEAHEATAVLHVVDNGPGMPPSVRSRIFEPFFTTKDNGTGLGMSIAHSIAAQHGGSIEVETDNHGTRCSLVLPRGQRANNSSSV